MANKICIDTNIFAYFIERNKDFFKTVEKEFKKIRAQKNDLCLTFLSQSELLVRPLAINDEGLIDFYAQLKDRFPISIIFPTENTPTITAQLRVKYQLKIPDSLNLATAITSNCHTFITNDGGLKKVSEIKILLLKEL